MSTTTRHDLEQHRERGEAAALAHVKDRIAERFPAVPPPVIETAIQRRWAEFDGSRVRDFVPILVERSVRADLAVPHR
jgi:hypothetical protein